MFEIQKHDILNPFEFFMNYSIFNPMSEFEKGLSCDMQQVIELPVWSIECTSKQKIR